MSSPRIAAGVYLAPGSVVIGDVEIGADSSVWFNAVIRGDVAPIRIGERSNVQDGAVLHVDRGTPCIVGDEVTIGHAAIVHGTTVGDGVTIGMGAVVLSRSEIGAEAIVAAAALVPEDAVVASGALVMGVPAREKRSLSDEERTASRENARRYVRNAAAYRAPSWERERKEADMAVDVDIDEGIAVVTMNRPQALNAFNSEQLDLLGAAFHALGQDRSVRVVILTGAGDRAFAAGRRHQGDGRSRPRPGDWQFGRKGQALTSAIERLPQPVIAAVNGYAFGGGCELAIACDIRLASRERPFRAAGSQPGHSARLGRHATAAPAHRTRSRGGDDLHGTSGGRRRKRIASAWSTRFIRSTSSCRRRERWRLASPGTARRRSARPKSLIALSFTGDPAAGLAAEVASFGAAFAASDRSEGMRAFVEKRTADFAND